MTTREDCAAQETQSQLADARKMSRNKNLSLDSFIISLTPYDDLRKSHGPAWDRARYAEAHVLFGDEPDNGHIEAIVTGSA